MVRSISTLILQMVFDSNILSLLFYSLLLWMFSLIYWNKLSASTNTFHSLQEYTVYHTNFFFANDILFIRKAHEVPIRTLNVVLHTLKSYLGLRINCSKSSFYINSNAKAVHLLECIFNIKVKFFPLNI